MPDMYMSIEKGVIEGFIGDPDVITARRLGELVKYYTLLNLRGSLFYLTMNQDSYDSLPDDLKKVVDDGFRRFRPKTVHRFLERHPV